MPKRILLLGASGTAGTAIRQALLSQTTANLTLVSRHANRLIPTSKRETIAALDVHNQTALSQVMLGQDMVISALSAENNTTELADLAQDIISSMRVTHVDRLVFMVAMGIYNEIPEAVGSQDNVRNNSNQVHNLKAAQAIEESTTNYTLLRPGFLVPGKSHLMVTHKGEPVTGNTTSLTSLGNTVVALVIGKLIANRESLGINEA